MEQKKLENFILEAKKGFATIEESRKKQLNQLTKFVSDRLSDSAINLIFICVHNSRRSHLSQVWAQIAARHYGIQNVFCYSGGTEVTEMHPATAQALRDSGVEVRAISHGKNPIYTIKYDNNARPVIGFSKLFDDSYNPQDNFAAIMVCSAADANCPYISTAAKRILLPFKDPKQFDDTPQQAEKYLERCKQIATEMLFAFSQVKS